MQVFIPYKVISKIAKTIDRKRHNNQINESVVIMKANSNFTLDWKNPDAWKNHSNVKLWDGKQIYWLYKYTKKLLLYYGKKYKVSIEGRLSNLQTIFKYLKQKYKKPLFILRPGFITTGFCKNHQQILLQKNYEHYSKYFGDK